MELVHFSHEHPLILNGEHKEELDDCEYGEKGVVRCCDGCAEVIVGGPSYSCSCSSHSQEGCNFNLHKCCAERPREIQHPLHTQHPLTLLVKPPYDGECDHCDGRLNNFTYHCSLCNFDLHIRCTFPLEQIQIRHHKHPLICLRRPALLLCDACDTEHKGIFYTCNTCIQSYSDQFFIHQDCALLPTTLKLSGHDHILNLAYSLPPEYSQFINPCEICSNRIRINTTKKSWIYYCGGCRYFVHLNCATASKRETSKTEPFMLIMEPCCEPDNTVEDLHQDVIHMPIPNESVSVVDHFLKNMKLAEENKREKITELDHFSHEHPLILFNIDQNGEEEEFFSGSKLDSMTVMERCNGCVRTIYNSSFYSCPQSQCKFLLHKCCAELPTEVRHPCHPQHHPFTLLAKASTPLGKFTCEYCKDDGCTGFAFHCASCNLFLDVICGLIASTIITHKAHPQHLLVLREVSLNDRSMRCNACFYYLYTKFAFECKTCNFKLHLRCSLLPGTVRHRYDKLHPFTLTYSPLKDHPDEYICELCERDVDPKFWFYHCVECDLSIHTYCFHN